MFSGLQSIRNSSCLGKTESLGSSAQASSEASLHQANSLDPTTWNGDTRGFKSSIPVILHPSHFCNSFSHWIQKYLPPQYSHYTKMLLSSRSWRGTHVISSAWRLGPVDGCQGLALIIKHLSLPQAWTQATGPSPRTSPLPKFILNIQLLSTRLISPIV